MAQMLVRCTVCGREERPDHNSSLHNGWPKCCGYTMRLESTKEFIRAVAHQPIGGPTLREMTREEHQNLP